MPGAETLVYEAPEKVRSLTLSPKGDRIAFVSGKRNLMLLDTEKDLIEKLADQEFWGHQNYSIAFSHDQSHLAFTAMNLFEQDVYIYSFATKEVTNLTNSAVSESAPVFTPDGKNLYMLTNRMAPQLPGRCRYVFVQSGLTEKPKTFGNRSLRTIVPKQENGW